jgi:gamma-glutamylputrescine oxidase
MCAVFDVNFRVTCFIGFCQVIHLNPQVPTEMSLCNVRARSASGALRQVLQRNLHVGSDFWGPRNPGEHVDSYYSRTCAPAKFRKLDRDIDVDVAVIGGGFAGINTAYSLSKRGASVAVLESNRVGWAASGRNGGFAHPGFSLDLFSLAKAVGESRARALWQLTFDSLFMMRSRMQRWEAQGRLSAADTQSGMLVCSWFDDAAATANEVKEGNRLLGQDYFQFWDRTKVRSTYATSKYYDAVFDPDSFHFHSLNYALEVANDAR